LCTFTPNRWTGPSHSLAHERNMQNILRILHYVIFGLVVICNAILVSVAVWNQSIGPSTSPSVFAVDMYIICLGALGLVFIFTILFLELSGKDSLTGTVWFEFGWISSSFVMHLAGASALSAILPEHFCLPTSDSTPGACTSTRTLLAFSWMITLVLFMYLITLILFIILWRNDHLDIWAFSVRHIPSPRPKSALSSEPPSPVLPRFNTRPLSGFIAPLPMPVIDPEPFLPQSYEPGLGYIIEPYQPRVSPVSRPIQVVEVEREERSYPTSFYPEFVQNALQDTPRTRVAAKPTASVQRSSSPPPLGDWPRRDILIQPVRPKQARHSSRIRTMPASDISASSRPSGPRSMPLGKEPDN